MHAILMHSREEREMGNSLSTRALIRIKKEFLYYYTRFVFIVLFCRYTCVLTANVYSTFCCMLLLLPAQRSNFVVLSASMTTKMMRIER